MHVDHLTIMNPEDWRQHWDRINRNLEEIARQARITGEVGVTINKSRSILSDITCIQQTCYYNIVVYSMIQIPPMSLLIPSIIIYNVARLNVNGCIHFITAFRNVKAQVQF